MVVVFCKTQLDEIWDGDAAAKAATSDNGDAATERVGSKRKQPAKASKLTTTTNGQLDDTFEIDRVRTQEFFSVLF